MRPERIASFRDGDEVAAVEDRSDAIDIEQAGCEWRGVGGR